MKVLQVMIFLSLTLLALNGEARQVRFQNNQPRMSNSDQQELMQELTKGINEFQQEHNGKIDFKLLKPLIADRLSDFYSVRMVTMEELQAFEKNYDQMASKYYNAPDLEKKQALLQLFANTFKELANKKIKKLKEGQICNKWDCEDHLACALVPVRLLKNYPMKRRCAGARARCSDDTQCCSGVCEIKKFKGKTFGSCQPVMRCFRPVALNQSCYNNPVCQNGRCMQVNWNTTGVDACKFEKQQCTKNLDCCSNLCIKHRCQPNFICSNCAEQGKRPTRGRKCCPGLYKGVKGVCIPEIEPVVIPEVPVSKQEPSEHIYYSLIRQLIELVIPSANAEDDNQVTNDSGDISSNTTDRSSDELIEDATNKVEESEAAKKLKQHMPLPSDFPIGPRTNWKTCELNFKNDYLYLLKSLHLLDIEFALAAFDYVTTGEGVKDYWDHSHDKIKEVAMTHREGRKKVFEEIISKEDTFRCLCFDRKGFPNLAGPIPNDPRLVQLYTPFTRDGNNAEFRTINTPNLSADINNSNPQENTIEKEDPLGGLTEKEWFIKNCPVQFQAFLDEANQIKDKYKRYNDKLYKGDASGIKYKKMIVQWLEHLAQYQASLAEVNAETVAINSGLAEEVGVFDWHKHEMKEYELFNFTVFPFCSQNCPNNTIALKGMSLGALLAAGAVAVVSAVSGLSFLSMWAAAGIIAGGAAAGGAGCWAFRSLQAEWHSQTPEIEDKVIRSAYKCTKKGTLCQDYQRILHQPINSTCGYEVPFESSACVRSFVVIDQDTILLDPWVPTGIALGTVVQDQISHADRLTEAAVGAIIKLKDFKPTAKVPMSYLSTPFIDETRAGYYLPKLTPNHWLSAGAIAEIKAKAKEYVIKEANLLTEEDTEALNKFADYVYQYHFIWPRKANPGTIMYPPPGLYTYMQLIVGGLGAAAQGNLISYEGYTELAQNHTQDLYDTINGYDTTPTLEAGNGQEVENGHQLAIQGGSNLSDKEDDDTKSQLKSKLNYYKARANWMKSVSKGSNIVVDKNGNLSVDGKLVGENLSEADASALKAIGRLKKIREKQKKELEQYRKETKNSPTAKRIAAAQKRVIGSFFSPSNSKNGALNSGKLGVDLPAPLKKEEPKRYDNFSHRYLINGNGYYSGYGNEGTNYGGSGESETETLGSESGDQYASGNEQYANGNTVKDEDAEKIASALEAMKKDKNAIKQGKSGLFDIITQAYFRSYKRIFSPKDLKKKE